MDKGKTRWSLLDFKFLARMVKIMHSGIKQGRAEDDWKRPSSDSEESYRFDAALRHLVEARNSTTVEEARDHFAAVATNAMILSAQADWRDQK
jgi:hypothetical protein